MQNETNNQTNNQNEMDNLTTNLEIQTRQMISQLENDKPFDIITIRDYIVRNFFVYLENEEDYTEDEILNNNTLNQHTFAERIAFAILSGNRQTLPFFQVTRLRNMDYITLNDNRGAYIIKTNR